MRITLLSVGLAVLLGILGSDVRGQSESNTKPSGVAEVASAEPQSASQSPVLQRRNPRYQVGRDDVLSISFPLSPELNQMVTVQPDGYIHLLSAGDLYVQGLTVPEVVAALQKAYAKTLHDPIIDVDLKDFQKPFFVVGGQVAKPGQFDLRYETTVSEAIAIAGGLTPAAKSQVFLFHRVSSNWVEVKNLSLKDIMHGRNVNEDAMLQPGDMIFVPENKITKVRQYLPYNVGMYVNPAGLFP